MKVCFITERLTGVGIKLTGIREVLYADLLDAQQLLERAKVCDVVLVSRRFAKELEAELNELKKQGRVVIEIPEAGEVGEDVLRELVKEVIGYELRV